MLSTRFHDEVHVPGRAHATKTPGRMGANRKENPGGRGGAQTTLTGKGQERIAKGGMGTPGGQYGKSKLMGFNGISNVCFRVEPQRLFKGGKVEAQPSQSLSRAFALLDKTNKTPHPKSRKAVSIMTPVAGSAQKAKLKQLATPAPQLPQTTVRPSAARLSIRAPRSSIARDFETPAPQGRRAHWDVGDVEVGPEMDGDVEVGGAEAEVVALDEGEEEIEYMPPTAISEYSSFVRLAGRY